MRGAGAADRLIDFAESQARLRGAAILKLLVAEENARAVAF
jgi:ribosomal protein S18 acetylase RimI-like enzyme